MIWAPFFCQFITVAIQFTFQSLRERNMNYIYLQKGIYSEWWKRMKCSCCDFVVLFAFLLSVALYKMFLYTIFTIYSKSMGAVSVYFISSQELHKRLKAIPWGLHLGWLCFYHLWNSIELVGLAEGSQSVSLKTPLSHLKKNTNNKKREEIKIKIT